MAQAAKSRTSAIKTFMVSGMGTALEFYDFAIYGIAAALVFNTVFFPGTDPLIGTLYAFAAFGAGFFARPLGGVILGHFGDKIGRRKILIITLITMGVATFAIGLIPTHAVIGAWAPVLLVALRLLQGFAAGGEWGGAALFGIENAPDNRRALWGSFTSVGISIGSLLGTSVFAIVSFASEGELTAGAWRIPFLLGGTLVLVGLFARLTMPKDVIEEKPEEEILKLPALDAIRRSPKTILLALALSYGYNTVAYIGSTFFLTYLATIGYSSDAALSSQVVYGIVAIASAFACAILSDKIGRRPVTIVGALAMTVFLYAFFPLVGIGVVWLAAFALGIIGLLTGAMQGPMPAFLGEQFPARMRFSGMSVSYQIGAALGGGTASFAATGLLILSDQNPVSVAMYGTFAMLVVACSAWGLREGAFKSTREINE